MQNKDVRSAMTRIHDVFMLDINAIRPEASITPNHRHGSAETDVDTSPNIEFKLEIDGGVIGSQKQQILYCYQFLEGVASSTIRPWIEQAERMESSEGTTMFALEQFYAKLRQAFQRKDIVQHALTRLTRVTQGDRAFNEFRKEVDQLIFEANGHDWTNNVKIGYLRGGLSPTLFNQTLILGDDVAYEEFADAIGLVAGRVESAAKRIPVVAGPAQPRDANAMDWERAFRTLLSTPSSNGSTFPVANNNNQRRRARWVSKEVREDRRKKNLCMRCGLPGHMQGQCTLAPALPPRQETVRAVADAIDLEENGVIESGNKFLEEQLVKRSCNQSIAVNSIINDTYNIKTIIDTGSTAYALISQSTAHKLLLERIPLSSSVTFNAFSQTGNSVAKEFCYFSLDTGGVTSKQYAFVIPNLSDQLILGYPWLKKHSAVVDCDLDTLTFKKQGWIIRGLQSAPIVDVQQVNAATFHHFIRRSLRTDESSESVFAASVQDIER
ncbi:hypothetical protein V1512DRAFT_278601, partial [Lipomyces arxii]|uniref:uncharacterized protein n=1 Tax=Lipomyces arxii TaxID=56418 RepID=UPI0034CF8218